MNHVYQYEDGSFVADRGTTTTNLQQAVVGPKASVTAKSGTVTTKRRWRKLPKLNGKAVPVTIVNAAQPTPKSIVDLYQRAQVNADMDSPTCVGGNDHYGVASILEALAGMAGWTLPPRMKLAEREQWLRDNGREDEMEYLGVNGGE